MLEKQEMLERIDKTLATLEQRRAQRRQKLMTAKALSAAIGASSKMLATACPVSLYGVEPAYGIEVTDAHEHLYDVLYGIDAGPGDTQTEDLVAPHYGIATDANGVDVSDAGEGVDGLSPAYGIETDASSIDDGLSFDGEATLYGIATDAGRADDGLSIDGEATLYGIAADAGDDDNGA